LPCSLQTPFYLEAHEDRFSLSSFRGMGMDMGMCSFNSDDPSHNALPLDRYPWFWPAVVEAKGANSGEAGTSGATRIETGAGAESSDRAKGSFRGVGLDAAAQPNIEDLSVAGMERLSAYLGGAGERCRAVEEAEAEEEAAVLYKESLQQQLGALPWESAEAKRMSGVVTLSFAVKSAAPKRRPSEEHEHKARVKLLRRQRQDPLSGHGPAEEADYNRGPAERMRRLPGATLDAANEAWADEAPLSSFPAYGLRKGKRSKRASDDDEVVGTSSGTGAGAASLLDIPGAFASAAGEWVPSTDSLTLGILSILGVTGWKTERQIADT
jgi:hypothetical protein